MGRPRVIVHEASVRTAPKDSADYPFPGERIDGALRQVIAWSIPSSHIFPLFLCSHQSPDWLDMHTTHSLLHHCSFYCPDTIQLAY